MDQRKLTNCHLFITDNGKGKPFQIPDFASGVSFEFLFRNAGGTVSCDSQVVNACALAHHGVKVGAKCHAELPFVLKVHPWNLQFDPVHLVFPAAQAKITRITNGFAAPDHTPSHSFCKRFFFVAPAKSTQAYGGCVINRNSEGVSVGIVTLFCLFGRERFSLGSWSSHNVNTDTQWTHLVSPVPGSNFIQQELHHHKLCPR